MNQTTNLQKPWVQAAIDVPDLKSAVAIAQMAVDAGCDWIEAGTPLLYGEGYKAITALKQIAGERPVVADFKAQDGCYSYFMEAKKAGADYAVVTVVNNDCGTLEALRARKDYGIKVLADLFGVSVADAPKRAQEVEAMGVDGICIHFGFDESQYNKTRRQSDGLREVKNAVSIPVSCAADTLEEAIEAMKQGADWVFFGADYLNEASPEKLPPLKHYVDTIHNCRR